MRRFARAAGPCSWSTSAELPRSGSGCQAPAVNGGSATATRTRRHRRCQRTWTNFAAALRLRPRCRRGPRTPRGRDPDRPRRDFVVASGQAGAQREASGSQDRADMELQHLPAGARAYGHLQRAVDDKGVVGHREGKAQVDGWRRGDGDRQHGVEHGKSQRWPHSRGAPDQTVVGCDQEIRCSCFRTCDMQCIDPTQSGAHPRASSQAKISDQ
jgi:hypothetical protein